MNSSSIVIDANPFYISQISYVGSDNLFCWACRITITNNGDCAITIVEHRWKVIDQNGYHKVIDDVAFSPPDKVINIYESVECGGVVALNSSSGVMIGRYTFLDSNNNSIVVEIPIMSLDSIHSFTKKPN